MMVLHPQPQPQPSTSPFPPSPSSSSIPQPSSPPQPPTRKRKAATPPDSSSRLSKRLSLLNLEQNGQTKLYVPVEHAQRSNITTTYSPSTGTVSRPVTRSQPTSLKEEEEEEPMQLDDTKHKVYIYNLDDELSSEEEEKEEGDGGNGEKVVFLPDIERELRRRRMIPGAGGVGTGGLLPGVGVPGGLGTLQDLGDAAGREMVLYRVPRAISVPEEQDSVRKAIIEARARMRERGVGGESGKRDGEGEGQGQGARVEGSMGVVGEEDMDDGEQLDDDPDAMELD